MVRQRLNPRQPEPASQRAIAVTFVCTASVYAMPSPLLLPIIPRAHTHHTVRDPKKEDTVPESLSAQLSDRLSSHVSGRSLSISFSLSISVAPPRSGLRMRTLRGGHDTTLTSAIPSLLYTDHFFLVREQTRLFQIRPDERRAGCRPVEGFTLRGAAWP